MQSLPSLEATMCFSICVDKRRSCFVNNTIICAILKFDAMYGIDFGAERTLHLMQILCCNK